VCGWEIDDAEAARAAEPVSGWHERQMFALVAFCQMPGSEQSLLIAAALQQRIRTDIIATDQKAPQVRPHFQARYLDSNFHASYVGPMYSKAPRELWPYKDVASRGVAPQFSNPGPQIKGYGCLAHPDYGLS
jgi:hypothetical protein